MSGCGLTQGVRSADSSVVKEPDVLQQESPIGKSPPRKEGVAKVTGKAVYVDDLPVAGAIYGATVRSKVARGHLRGITYHPGVPWEDFHIVTAADIPGENTIALIEKGSTVRAALLATFNDRLLDVVLKAVGEAPFTKDERR